MRLPEVTNPLEVYGAFSYSAWGYDPWSRPTRVTLPAGPGRSAGGAFQGFARGFDTLDRLESAGGLGAATLSGTPLGADWAWGGGSRLYAMTTRGALGTAVRYGYHGGAGPQVPGLAPEAASEWKLGRMSWGGGGGAPAEAPAVAWGDFGFGWRGNDGSPADGAKIGRQVLGSPGEMGLLAGLGWSWIYDNGVRLRTAIPGLGDLEGRGPPAVAGNDQFTFGYGEGDELVERVRQATGDVDLFTPGAYGRLEAFDGAAFAYDPVGRRLADDRFEYAWDWRGQLVETVVKASWPDADGDGQPDLSPYAGHRLRYDYDALGRLTRRLHEGETAGDGTRPFIEERQYVWEGDHLAAEAGYGAAGDNDLRWRRTYVPGPQGLDDPVQVVVEIFALGWPFSGTARTYTYLRDELGTVIGLVAEDEGADPEHPPVPVRYRYTPYGAVHAETGPELLRARFDAEAKAAAGDGGAVIQAAGEGAAAGALVLDWSLPLDGGSLPEGVVVERLEPGVGWTALTAGEVVVGRRASDGIGTGDLDGELLVLSTAGWARARSYRVRLEPSLADRLGRVLGRSESLEWSVPATGAVLYDQAFAPAYDSWQAAAASLGGRFPSGQSRLFQGLWTDPVTGLSHARARWYDARTAAWLSEDPLDVDSPNLYAFVGHQPTMATDPSGEIAFVDNVVGGVASLAIGVAVEAAINFATGDDSWDYSWKDAGIDFGLGFATSGLSSLGELRHVAKLGTAGKLAVRAGTEIGLDAGAEIARHEWKGEHWTFGEVAGGAVRNFSVGEAGAAVGRRLGLGKRLGGGSSSPPGQVRRTDYDSWGGEFLDDGLRMREQPLVVGSRGGFWLRKGEQDRIADGFDALNPGPLPDAIAETFAGGRYNARLLEHDTTFYRVHGGRAGVIGRRGTFVTAEVQVGGLQSMIDLALQPGWGNRASEVSRLRVPRGTIVYEGIASSQGGTWVGGQSQTYLLNVSVDWILP